MTLPRIKIYHLIANLAMIILSILICLIFVDLVLHLTKYRSLLKREVYPKNYFVKDDILGYKIGKNLSTTTHYFADGFYDIWSNEIGCFDRTFSQDQDFIYLTGDSFAWGFTPFEEKWGTLIEKLIGIRVLKCGVGGYGTKQEYLKTKMDLENLLKPKLIVLGYLSGNDIEDDFNYPNYSVYEGYLVNNLYRENISALDAEKIYQNLYKYCSKNPKDHTIEGLKCWFNNHSIVFNLIKNNTRNVIQKILPDSLLTRLGIINQGEKTVQFEQSPVNLSQNLLNLLSFDSYAKENKINLLVVLIPGNNEKQKEFLRGMNIDFIDLDTEFKKYDMNYRKDIYWSSDGHWNVKGNHLAGYIVAKYLLQKGYYLDLASKEAQINEIEKRIKNEFYLQK